MRLRPPSLPWLSEDLLVPTIQVQPIKNAMSRGGMLNMYRMVINKKGLYDEIGALSRGPSKYANPRLM